MRETTIVVDVLGILEAGGVKDGHGVLFPSTHVVLAIIIALLAAAATVAVGSSFAVRIYHPWEEEGKGGSKRERERESNPNLIRPRRGIWDLQ